MDATTYVYRHTKINDGMLVIKVSFNHKISVQSTYARVTGETNACNCPVATQYHTAQSPTQ